MGSLSNRNQLGCLWSKLSSVRDTTVCVSCPLTAMYCCSNAGSRLGEGVARRVTQRVLSGWVPDTTVCSPRRLTSVYCRSRYLHKKKYDCFQPFVFIYFISLITYKTMNQMSITPNSLEVLAFNGNNRPISWKNVSSRISKKEKLFPTNIVSWACNLHSFVFFLSTFSKLPDVHVIKSFTSYSLPLLLFWSFCFIFSTNTVAHLPSNSYVLFNLVITSLLFFIWGTFY